MPNSASPKLAQTQGAYAPSLLRTAYKEFERFGRIRADTATKLMREGVIVGEIEKQWASSGAWVF